MSNSIVNRARARAWQIAAVLGVALLLALFPCAQIALADVPGEVNVACLGMNANACVANDVDLAVIYQVPPTACMDDGTGNLYAEVMFIGELDPNASTRYDIGIWIALEGGNAKTDSTNTCYHGILRPLEVLPDYPWTAYGPYRDEDGDWCGDIIENDGMNYADIQTLHIKCVDTGGGLMSYVNTCVSWDNNAGTTCSTIAQAVPGTTSKCSCGNTLIDPPIPISQIVVRKVTIPSGDTQLFPFVVSGPGPFLGDSPNFSLADGDGWGSGTLPAGGTYSVVETVPTGWDLTSLDCSDGVNSYDPAGFIMPAGNTVECTATNTKRGTIIVEKQTDPDYAPESFTFTGDAAGTISDGGQIVVSNLVPGTYTSVESAAPGELTSIVCDDANSTGDINTRTATFNLEAGETVTCIFYNDVTVDLEIDKDDQDVVQNVGSMYNYTLLISHSAASSGATAHGVTVVDTLDPYVDYVSLVSISDPDDQGRDCAYDSGTHQLTCNLYEVPQGEKVTVVFRVQVKPGVQTGSHCEDYSDTLSCGDCPGQDSPPEGPASPFGLGPDICNDATVSTTSVDIDSTNDWADEPTDASNPTAVELAFFRATPDKAYVELDWRTLSEVRLLGFNLYRSTTLTGKRTRLNAGLIVSDSEMDTSFGADYSYMDWSAKGKRPYFYWLEDVNLYGGSAFHGPVSVTHLK
jgi:hypothetical protein